MAIDKLQDKIRKLKNPLLVDFSMCWEHIPLQIREETSGFANAYAKYCTELLEDLREIVPAVRFSFSLLALLGCEGLDALETLLNHAHKLGYYVMLDCAEMLNPQNTSAGAEILFDQGNQWYFDGLIVTAYTGSDALRPYVAKLKNTGKDLFVVSRTSNKSASEVQDLLSGSRHTHLAVAEMVNRLAEPLVGRSGYSQVAIMGAASAADSNRALRSKFKNLFILLDGCDYPNANTKNCSYGFDKLGHGAMACASLYVTAAWQNDFDPSDYVGCAVRACERLRKNFARYVTIL